MAIAGCHGARNIDLESNRVGWDRVADRTHASERESYRCKAGQEPHTQPVGTSCRFDFQIKDFENCAN
jgi:hypothetical protein